MLPFCAAIFPMLFSYHNLNTILFFIQDYWTSGVEILILSALIYYGTVYLQKIPGTRILIWLVLTFFALTFISQVLNLVVLNWLLRSFSIFLTIALVIIFQPELRRALNELGLHRLFTSALQRREKIEELSDIVFDLSTKGFGGLIALAGHTDLDPIIESGVKLDALLSKELMLTLFHPKTLLHDGAVIISNDRILGAGCIFPLSQRDDLDRSIGLRHRAGLGLSEDSDAIILVISEETGHVAICYRGTIERNLNEEQFQERLNQLIIHEDNESPISTSLERKTNLSTTGRGPLVSDQSKYQSKYRSNTQTPQDINGEM